MLCTYLLTDPITEEIRYVGKTKQILKYRLSGHLTDARLAELHRERFRRLRETQDAQP